MLLLPENMGIVKVMNITLNKCDNISQIQRLEIFILFSFTSAYKNVCPSLEITKPFICMLDMTNIWDREAVRYILR